MQQPAGTGGAQGAGEVLAAQALVLAQAHHGLGDLLREVRGGVGAGDGHAQGQHVDGHRGGLQGGGGRAHHHGQRHDHVPLAREPVDVAGVRAEQHVHPGAPGRRAQLLEVVAVLRGERFRHVHGAPAGVLRAALAATHRRQRGHGIDPVAFIRRALLAAPVCKVLLDEFAEGVVARRGCGLADQPRAVERGDPAAQARSRVPVDHQVVIELHEPHMLVVHAQDHVAEELALHHGCAVSGHVRALLVHHGGGERERIRGRTQVNDAGTAPGSVRNALLCPALVLANSQPQGLGLGHGLGDGVGQPVDVHVTRADLHDLAHHVVRGRRIEPLGVPDPFLRPGQREPLCGVGEVGRGDHARLVFLSEQDERNAHRGAY